MARSDSDAASGFLFGLQEARSARSTSKTTTDGLLAERDQLRTALRDVMNELGVPQPGYLQPVANAYEIAEEALKRGE